MTTYSKHPAALAWDQWGETPEAQKAAEGGCIEDQYMENRLHRAFMAGYDAAVKVVLTSLGVTSLPTQPKPVKGTNPTRMHHATAKGLRQVAVSLVAPDPVEMDTMLEGPASDVAEWVRNKLIVTAADHWMGGELERYRERVARMKPAALLHEARRTWQ